MSRAQIHGERGRPRSQKLSWPQRRFLFVLGVPAFGLALAYTIVTTYIPVLLTKLSGPAVTGLLIAAEGLLALVIPLFVGNWSDRLQTRIGGRFPFMLAGGGISVAALILMPLGSGSLTWIAISLGFFFLGYFVYYAPYYALYPDLIPDNIRGRSQGFQGALRSLGLLIALAGGGVLLSLWRPLPFVIGAAAVAAVTLGLLVRVRGRMRRAESESEAGRSGKYATTLTLVRRNAAIRNWAIANACWEAAIGSLRTFVVLYFTVGLGLSLKSTSGALALVGASAIVAAPLAGKFGDRYGVYPVMQVSVWVFAIGLLPTLFTTNTAYIVCIVPVAFAAVVLMTLPYTILMGLLPDQNGHGAGAGLFELSRGVGVIVGPLVAGFATAVLDTVGPLSFNETDGYSAIFGVSSLLLILSVPFLRRAHSHGWRRQVAS